MQQIKDMDDYYNLAGVIGIDPFVAVDDLPKSDYVDEAEFGIIVYETDVKL